MFEYRVALVKGVPGQHSSGSIAVEPDVPWRDGTTPGEPALQTHWITPTTVVIRQSLTTHYEAPFVYLLLGTTGAFLLDTGALEDPAAWPLRATIDSIIDSWVAKNPCSPYPLTVAHTHGHDDHIAGDAQFRGRADTIVVGPTVGAVTAFFGLENWPNDAATLDLGDRAVSVIPGPGHEQAAIVVHDPSTGILFTGDTVYPGRLYVEDMPAYLATLARLVALLDVVPVSAILGGHIEMSSTPGRQFELGSRQHPHEAALAMTPGQLRRLLNRARDVADKPGMHPYDDVAIVNGRAAIDAYFQAGRS